MISEPNEADSAIVANVKERATEVREQIIRAATKLLDGDGREAASTRAVSAAAEVQAPTIYRHFGDMRGLLEAVTQATLAGYVQHKATRQRTGDLMADLRRGWDEHVAFGLAHPTVYVLIYGDPSATANSPTVREGFAKLLALVDEAAREGHLRVSVPHAARLIASAGQGVTLALIATAPEARDPQLSTAMREAVLTAITLPAASKSPSKETPGSRRVAARAVALRAVVAEAPGAFSSAEQHLLGEWLDRLSRSDPNQRRAR